jgi:hypothetical protein
MEDIRLPLSYISAYESSQVTYKQRVVNKKKS